VLHDDIAFTGVAGQAELVRRGDASAAELVELALARIERLDRELNAFAAVYAERAQLEATQADARRRAGDDPPQPARSRAAAPRGSSPRPRPTRTWCNGCARRGRS
jgi:hypothetical protein